MQEEEYPELLYQISSHKGGFVLYFLLRLLISVVLAIQVKNGVWQNVFLCFATILLFMVPSFIESKWHIRLPDAVQNTILLFIFCAEILGEIEAFYIWFPWWDTMLHTLNGFIVAAIGFSLVQLLNENEKILFKLSPIFVVIVAFCFSMTVGIMWEFFECGCDLMFGLDMQKDTVIQGFASVMLDPAGGNHPTAIHEITSVIVNGQDLGLGGYLDIGLLDTMKDLFVNFIGALVFSVMGYHYMKSEQKGKFVDQFLVKKEKQNARDINCNSCDCGSGGSTDPTE